MAKYITPPPVLDENIPTFVAMRYNLYGKYIESLIVWAKKEYYDYIMHLYSLGDTNTAKVLETKYTYLDFLARSKQFKGVAEKMTDNIWNSLDRKSRRVLTDARMLLGE